MMYRISICDDEPFFLKRLKEMTIAFFSDKEEVQLQTFHDPAFLLKHLPASDLFLLDVKMPEVSGMELAQKIRLAYPNASIIFISSLYEPVFESFQYSPLRYVRKENLDTELPAALSAFVNIQRSASETFEIPFNGYSIVLPIRTIRYLESTGHYIDIHTVTKDYRIRGKLSDYLPVLLQYDMAQPGKSYLVNLAFVSVFTKSHVILDNGLDLTLTRGYKSTFHSAFMKYQRSFHSVIHV